MSKMNPDQQPTRDNVTIESVMAQAQQKTPDKQLPREGLMTEVLAATLSGDGSSLTDIEWQSLQQIARSYPPQTEVDLGVATQLVTAFLLARFPILADETTLFNKMSLRVAGSLWSHPAGKQRLIRFWELISGQVRS
jgi:hypothetical protein